MLTIISFFGVLVVLVLAHECGHFFTAKAFKVKVEEFGLGFPPRLFSFKRGETRYSFNAIPAGGFVKMAGEEDPGIEGSLAGKGAGVRVVVLAAGSLMNFLLPILLFSVALMVPHDAIDGTVVVGDVAPASPAARAGLQAGDIIISIDGKPVRNIGDVQRDIQLNLGNKIDITYQRGDNTGAAVAITPRWQPPEGEGAAGIMVTMSEYDIVSLSYPFWEAVPKGAVQSFETLVLFKNVIIGMIIGTVPALVAGPVGIAQMTGEVAKAGLSPLLEFAAFFSINLAIINIFPLPALDGGRIAFVLVEWLRRGKRVSPRIERTIHLVGFALLLGALLMFTYQDIMRIIVGESLLP